MRLWTVSLILLSVAGCGALPARRAAVPQTPVYLDSPAMALAISPAWAGELPGYVLDRELRQPAAFVGFDEITATFYYVRTDDRQLDDGWIFRRAVSERVGISYR